MNFSHCLLVVAVLILIGCEKDNSTGGDAFTLSQIDIVKSWEVVSVEGAPSIITDTSSIWTFNADGTYTWFFDFSDYYNDWVLGTYYLENNILHLSGNIPDIVDSIIPLEFSNIPLNISKSNTLFSFLDKNNDKWIYQIAETEPEYSKSIFFYEQSPYTGDCLLRPPGTVCLGFSDGYIWLINTSGGACNDELDYYSEGRYVAVACGGNTYPYNSIEFHHILNTNLSKKVIK